MSYPSDHTNREYNELAEGLRQVHIAGNRVLGTAKHIPPPVGYTGQVVIDRGYWISSAAYDALYDALEASNKFVPDKGIT